MGHRQPRPLVPPASQGRPGVLLPADRAVRLARSASRADTPQRHVARSRHAASPASAPHRGIRWGREQRELLHLRRHRPRATHRTRLDLRGTRAPVDPVRHRRPPRTRHHRPGPTRPPPALTRPRHRIEEPPLAVGAPDHVDPVPALAGDPVGRLRDHKTTPTAESWVGWRTRCGRHSRHGRAGLSGADGSHPPMHSGSEHATTRGRPGVSGGGAAVSA